MDPKMQGAIHQILSVKDEEGKEYFCPYSSLRNPNLVTEEEKKDCTPQGSSKEAH
jgi:hypothetical protein